MYLRPSRRALRGIERDLAHSDPDLDMLFTSFTVLTQGTRMPRLETTRTWRLRLFRWLGCFEDGKVRTGAPGLGRFL
jgi:hypothetical protein